MLPLYVHSVSLQCSPLRKLTHLEGLEHLPSVREAAPDLKRLREVAVVRSYTHVMSMVGTLLKYSSSLVVV